MDELMNDRPLIKGVPAAFDDLPLIHAPDVPPRIAAALQAMREGRAVVLQDDDDRENEADLIVAAQALSVVLMALLIRECSGIVCLCLPSETVEALELPAMVAHNESRSEEHTSELQSHLNLVCRLLLEKKKK